MSDILGAQFLFHDDTIDILLGNRVVNHVQLTNTHILDLHRVAKLDFIRVFTVYTSSVEPGLYAILFRLSLINEVATLVPVIRTDLSSLLAVSPSHSVSGLSPERTRILMYLQEEHLCLQLAPTYIVYANLRLLHRVDSGSVGLFVLPQAASCLLDIPKPESITSAHSNDHLYFCVGNLLLMSRTPISIHLLSKRQTPLTFRRVATLSTFGQYLSLDYTLFAGSAFTDKDIHRPGYEHPSTLLIEPIDVTAMCSATDGIDNAYGNTADNGGSSSKCNHAMKSDLLTMSPPALPPGGHRRVPCMYVSNPTSEHPAQVCQETPVCVSPPAPCTNSTTTIKHYILNLSGTTQAPVLIIGTLVHNAHGCFSFFTISSYTLAQVQVKDWQRYTKSEMMSMRMFKLCKTIGEINFDELCTYRLPSPSEGETKIQPLGRPAPCHIETLIYDFLICPIRALNSYFFFSISFVAKYTSTSAFRFQYTFRINSDSREINVLSKQVYLSVPRAPDCNEFSLNEQAVLEDTIVSTHLTSFISDRSENVLYIHDDTKVYFIMMFNEKLKFVSGKDLTLFLYTHSNTAKDAYNIYNFALFASSMYKKHGFLEQDEVADAFRVSSCRYISQYNFGLSATFLRLFGFGKNLMLIQGIDRDAVGSNADLPAVDGELIKITVFLERDGKYVSSVRYLVFPHGGHEAAEASLKHALFTSFERYRQLHVVFCVEADKNMPTSCIKMSGGTLQVNNLARIASVASITRTSSGATLGSDASTDSLLTIDSETSNLSEMPLRPTSLRVFDMPTCLPCPNTSTGISLETPTKESSSVRDFHLLTIAFSMSGRYLYSTGFHDPSLKQDEEQAEHRNQLSSLTSYGSDNNFSVSWFQFLSSDATRFRCLLHNPSLVPHRIFYVFPNDCLRISFVTPHNPRERVQRHKIHVERFYLPFLSLATCFLSSSPTILRTYISHAHTTLFRRFITNVITSSHYLFSITLNDKLHADQIIKYSSFSLYDLTMYINEFTSVLLLSTTQHYDYDTHITNYLLNKLVLSNNLPVDRFFPYLVTGVLCLTRQLGPRATENTSHGLAYDLPSWLETYLSMEHIGLDYSLLIAKSNTIMKLSIFEEKAFRFGLFRVLPSIYLRGLFMAIGDTEYRTVKVPNALVTFYYILTNRLAVLANLYTRAQNTKIAAYLKGYTFTGEGSVKARDIARKNAFVLLSKCDYYMAAAWFFLAADFDNMIMVLVDTRYMANIDLGITVFRYLRDVACNAALPFSRVFPDLNISQEHFTSMQMALFDATIGKYVITTDTESTNSMKLETPRQQTIISVSSKENTNISYKVSTNCGKTNIKEFVRHCTVAYDLLYYYFVLSQYEENSELLTAIITDVMATIISFTQHITLETSNTAELVNTVSVVLHVLNNFVFLCFQYKLVDEIRSILNILYRLYSCNIFGPIEKIRILNLSMYILALSRRTFAAVEGLDSFFLPSEMRISRRQLFNAFELSFMSIIHLHSNTLAASLLYNAFLYYLNPSRYLGRKHAERLQRLKEMCATAANRELSNGPILPDTSDIADTADTNMSSELVKQTIATILLYMCLGFFTGAGKRSANMLWEKYKAVIPGHSVMSQLDRHTSYFDITNTEATENQVIRRRKYSKSSETAATDNSSDRDSATDTDFSSYNYSVSEDDNAEQHTEAESRGTEKRSSKMKRRRSKLQSPDEIQRICSVVCSYFRNIVKYTQSPYVMRATNKILDSFGTVILPVVQSSIDKFNSREVHDVTDSLMGLVSMLSATNETVKKLLESLNSGTGQLSDTRVLQSESECNPTMLSDIDTRPVIQHLLLKQREGATSASSDNEKLKRPKPKEHGIITISDIEMHTAMLSDSIGGTQYDDLGDGDRDRANQPFVKHPILRRSLGFLVCVGDTHLMIERYDALLDIYSYLTLTPGGHTRYLPSAFSDALAATAHAISMKPKNALTVGFEMLINFLNHGNNSFSHIVCHGLANYKRNDYIPDRFIETHQQNQLADVRVANLFYILLSLHEYTVNNGSMLLFRNTMQSKYGIHIQLNQLLEKTGICPYKDILPIYYDIFKEIQRNALTAAEVSYLEMLELSTTSAFQEKFLLIKKLLLLEIYYLISRYKVTPTKETHLHRMRQGHDSTVGSLLPPTLITFIKNPFVCFLSGILNRISYSPRLKIGVTSTDLLHKPKIPLILANELIPAMRNTVFWQTHVAKDWKGGYSAADKIFETRLLQYRVLLSSYILLYFYPSSILVFSIRPAEPLQDADATGAPSSGTEFSAASAYDMPGDDIDSESSNNSDIDATARTTRRTRPKGKGKKALSSRTFYELSLVLEYTNVTSFIQTSEETLHLLFRANYIISLTLRNDSQIATVSAPIHIKLDAERIIGGMGAINDFSVLFNKSAYSVFCKDGVIVPPVQNSSIKFGFTDASLRLKTASIHDMVLFTNFQALALISYFEQESPDNASPKLILAKVNLLNCSIMDGIELTESYVRMVPTKIQDIQVLMLFGQKEYCILCKHIAGATDTYIKAESGFLPHDMVSTLVVAEALCTGDKITYRLVYSTNKNTVKAHIIVYHVNVV